MADKAMNMPKDVEARIRALPGNSVCSDCSNIKPQWASVTYGTLVCLECSGQHRSLGVHLSFVRSVQMDAWKPEEIQRMEKSGGNSALVEYLSSRGIEKSMPIAQKYNTKQAAYFKERLTRWVQGKTEPPPDPGRYDPATGGSDAQGAEPLPGETTEEYNARQARLREVARERLRQKFGDKGMGGVGSEPQPTTDGLDMGNLGGGAVRLLGGAVSGVGSFLKNTVIENEGLHSTIRSTAGAVGETAGGAWSTIRRSIGESDTVGGLVGGLKRHATAEDGALRQGIGWTAGAVGGIWEKGSTVLGDFMTEENGGQAPSSAPTGPKSQRPDARSDEGLPHKKNSMKFSEDWTDWGEDEPVQQPAPPEPTREDMSRMAQDLGMKLSLDKGTSGTNGHKTAPAPAPAPAAPAAAPPAASPEASPVSSLGESAKAKKKGLAESDDFFSEFGL